MLPYGPAIHRRRSIRLAGYDYTLGGAYTITICVQERLCLLGEIVDGVMHCGAAGRMVEKWWSELPRKFPTVAVDAFVVMPNHLHGIVVFSPPDPSSVGAGTRAYPRLDSGHIARGAHAGTDLNEPEGLPLPAQDHRPSVGGVVQWFKTMTTNAYIRGVKDSGWAPFARRLWQRNYYEHIIRNDEALDRHRCYIFDNPTRWAEDRENPVNARGNQGTHSGASLPGERRRAGHHR